MTTAWTPTGPELRFTKTGPDTWTHRRTGTRIDRLGDGRYRIAFPVIGADEGHSEPLVKLEAARRVGRAIVSELMRARERDHAEATTGAATPTVVHLKQLDERMTALRAQVARAREELSAVAEVRDRVVGERLAELTDEQIMGDEATLRWVLREAWSHTGAHNRIERLAKPSVPELSVGGVDSRDEYMMSALLNPEVSLTRGQDIKHVAEALRAWVKVWGLGRRDVYVGVSEADLCEYGSYSGMYDPATDTVVHRRNSRELSTMPLEEWLAHIADALPKFSSEGARREYVGY